MSLTYRWSSFSSATRSARLLNDLFVTLSLSNGISFSGVTIDNVLGEGVELCHPDCHHRRMTHGVRLSTVAVRFASSGGGTMHGKGTQWEAAVSTFAHLVGSIPEDTPEAAMTAALERLGPHLRWLPDGETGPRRDWIVHLIDSFRAHPDLELKRDGQWTDYDDVPVFRVRDGHTLTATALDLGYASAFEHGFPVFARLRAEHNRPDLAFQVGIPGDFDLALFTFGPSGPFRHRAPFREATLAEIAAIHSRAGDEVVFQIEVPAELIFVARMPPPAQPAMAAYLARGITSLAGAAPVGVRFGVHLCLGDMNHRALARMRDVRPLVQLANAIAARWPSGRPLEFVHAPLAAAAEPPPNQRRFYQPLEELRLDPSVALVAGFIHEGLSLKANRALHQHLGELLDRPVGVATTCGLGRRDPAAALETMDLAAAVCTAAAG